MYSEYIVRQIPFYEYTWLLQGASKFDLQSSYIDESSQKEFATAKYKEMVHHFVMKNVPAFRDESFITTINDYILKIDFQLVKINYPDGTSVDYMSTWEKINKELLVNTDFGKYCTASENNAGKILKDYPQILAGSEREKFDFVMNYVKGKFNWDDMRGIFTTRNVKEFMEKKSGSCAEINLFATGMMNAAGLEAYPVLVSTRQHGKVFPQYPFLHFFNYVIILVKVNNSDILADATEILCPNDRIPSRCINGKGLIVKKNEADWVVLTASDTSVITEKISVTFAPDLENINAELDIMYYSFDALEYRKIFNDDESKIKENWKDKGFDYIDSVSSDSFTEFDAPYRISFNITNPVSRVENKILINPFFNEPITENPFKQLVRQYPIDMIYPFKREYVSYINLPEEIEIAELPGDFKVANNLVNITYEIKKDNPQMIIVKGSYLFRQPLYQPKDYEKLKFYYKEIITRFNQPLILQKKVETLL
jgi:hypothetical protein